MKHLVLCTYELHPVNRGGCGVVVDALARKLAMSGWRVTVLGDMPEAELSRWRAWAIEKGAPEANLKTATLASLAEPPAGRTLFEIKSRQFAAGLRALFKKDPFDLVELHEYAGVAYELLRRRAEDGWCAPARIAVRIHGSLGMIDRQEGVVDPGPERAGMYLMERYAMASADVLIAPSRSLADEYAQVYGLDAARMNVCPPPMDLLLPSEWSPQPAEPNATDVLVFGKLQEIKGSDLVAQAASRLFEAEPELKGKVVFVGADAPCLKHGRPTSECLNALIAPAVRHRFEFRPHFPREQLPELAKSMRAGVIASRFESFCLAAHELDRLGLPLVVAQRPAFRDFFGADRAIPFDGTTAALIGALRRAFSDDEALRRLRARASLGYAETVPVYASAVAAPLRPDVPGIAALEIDAVHALAARPVPRSGAQPVLFKEVKARADAIVAKVSRAVRG